MNSLQPVDYISGLGQLPNPLRDMQEQMAQSLGLQRMQLQNQAATQEIDEDAAFRRAFEGLRTNPSPSNWASIAAAFPKHAKDIKAAYEMQQGPQLQADRTRKSERFIAAQGRNYELAAKNLEREIEAARAGNQEPDEMDVAILDALRSGDPTRQQWATKALGTELAMAMGEEHFSAAFGALGLKEEGPTDLRRKYDEIVALRGKAAADAWLASETSPYEIVPITEGGGVKIVDMSGSGAPAAAGGAAPTASTTASSAPAPRAGAGTPRGVAPIGNAVEVAANLFPGVRVTDNRRDPNSKLGKANPDSWHVRSGGAIDVAPIPGMTFEQYVAKYRAAGYEIIEARDEVANPSGHATGPHWHVVLGAKKGATQLAGGGAVRVRSLQEAKALPKGTTFITPDGRRKVR